MDVKTILTHPGLEPWQKRARLAAHAEGEQPAPGLDATTEPYFTRGILCDLFEGAAPYRPRYVLPDYARLMAHGSAFLELDPPRDLFEATTALLVAYRYVPSITGVPVFLGALDSLLEPFRGTVDEATARNLLRQFLVQVDRVLADAFVHANLGPQDSWTAQTLLALERESCRAVPNLSLKVDETTPLDLLRLAVGCALDTGKPYFVADAPLRDSLALPYGIASCYNTLPIGGGSHTLVRLNLAALAREAPSRQAFLETALPQAVTAQLNVIAARVRFLVEEARYYERTWLIQEGLIHRERFTAMAGILGLHEAVQALGAGTLGQDEGAADLGEAILVRMQQQLRNTPIPYCEGTGGHAGLHAQSGIAGDADVTPGVRIRIGDEPDLAAQLRVQARFQSFFDTGVSDIVCLDPTARDHVDGVVHLVRAALAQGVRILSLATSNAEVIRVSGYLVKRKDLAKAQDAEGLREESAALGAEAVRNQGVLQRKVRTLG